ncbi:hypothetical protein THASP1DRAFT_32335 [Thamnocephalis sphaerospora]|uniref:Uncharacterized protein n=1 Tax=Thamnocephalis sphaerospora TaxID=78915 RepID=A0A4P9XJA6_9FUNG|nr:hypothetical protein THASP1DRAFT_32335 [Thamnocephalis sphaerospora]|eukprot:RKP05834.1 hypothetical protein THASP1DRAFT_32335 [Thamnocephalis sphaerospora]
MSRWLTLPLDVRRRALLSLLLLPDSPPTAVHHTSTGYAGGDAVERAVAAHATPPALGEGTGDTKNAGHTTDEATPLVFVSAAHRQHALKAAGAIATLARASRVHYCAIAHDTWLWRAMCQRVYGLSWEEWSWLRWPAPSHRGCLIDGKPCPLRRRPPFQAPCHLSQQDWYAAFWARTRLEANWRSGRAVHRPIPLPLTARHADKGRKSAPASAHKEAMPPLAPLEMAPLHDRTRHPSEFCRGWLLIQHAAAGWKRGRSFTLLHLASGRRWTCAVPYRYLFCHIQSVRERADQVLERGSWWPRVVTTIEVYCAHFTDDRHLDWEVWAMTDFSTRTSSSPPSVLAKGSPLSATPAPTVEGGRVIRSGRCVVPIVLRRGIHTSRRLSSRRVRLEAHANDIKHHYYAEHTTSVPTTRRPLTVVDYGPGHADMFTKADAPLHLLPMGASHSVHMRVEASLTAPTRLRYGDYRQPPTCIWRALGSVCVAHQPRAAYEGSAVTASAVTTAAAAIHPPPLWAANEPRPDDEMAAVAPLPAVSAHRSRPLRWSWRKRSSQRALASSQAPWQDVSRYLLDPVAGHALAKLPYRSPWPVLVEQQGVCATHVCTIEPAGRGLELALLDYAANCYLPDDTISPDASCLPLQTKRLFLTSCLCPDSMPSMSPAPLVTRRAAIDPSCLLLPTSSSESDASGTSVRANKANKLRNIYQQARSALSRRRTRYGANVSKTSPQPFQQ